MARYFSHTVILPDETHLVDFIVETGGVSVVYYPFVGEVHSTIYLENPILLSHRSDLQGKTIALNQLAWAMKDDAGNEALYAYSLTPCPACMGDRFTMTKI